MNEYYIIEFTKAIELIVRFYGTFYGSFIVMYIIVIEKLLKNYQLYRYRIKCLIVARDKFR